MAVLSCASGKKTSETPKPAETIDQTEAKPVATQNPSQAVSLQTVYFDFDKYTLRQDQLENANTMAESLKSNPTVKIQIQGNTDDRGSVEYNMALGTKRAESLKKHLVAHGVSADNISTISYGKEHPAVQGNGEEAWSKNRRADVVEQK
jgi:peptidoglycan-associated lipoprotein